jgi:hypothetical protein
VANVNRYRAYMKSLPAFVASKEGGEGFAEIAGAVLNRRRKGEIRAYLSHACSLR